MDNNLLKVNKVDTPSGMLYKRSKPLTLTTSQIKEISTRLGLNNSKEPTLQAHLRSLKNKLASTDYKVIKCYEYSLAGIALPYDMKALHEERETIRKQIRDLEEA
jgi:hypothetical protein